MSRYNDFMEIYKILRVRFYFTMTLLVVLFAFNILASELSLYWIYRWFDIPMHFIGGALVCWIWLVGVSWYKKSIDIDWLQALIGTFVIGVAWEFLEMYMKVAQMVPEYTIDSVKDVFVDMVGGLAAYIVWDLMSRRSNQYNNQLNQLQNNK